MSRPQGYVLLLGKILSDAAASVYQELTYEVLDHSSDTELPIKQQADALIVRQPNFLLKWRKRLLDSE